MATQVYTALAAQWDAVIGTGINDTIGQSIAAAAQAFTAAGVLGIIIFGYLMAVGQLSTAVGARRIFQIASVATLLTAGYFNQFIQTPAMDTIPQWISQATGGNNTQGLPQQFDQIRNQVGQHEAAILQQANGITPSVIAQRLECAVITLMVFIELTIVFVIYEISRGMMGILVAVAPLIIWLYIFDTLRPVVMNLAGAAISILLLQVMLSIIVTMNVAADNAFMQQVAIGGDVDVQIEGMMQIFTFFLFGCVMAVLTPEIAAKIGNGVTPSVVPLVKNLALARGRT